MSKSKPKVHGGRKSMRYRGTKCLNCNQPLDKSDVYCPYCSQLNSDKQLSAKDFLAEFLSSILVYDSRIRTTFKDLLFRPGVITKNYVKGQRLKYANPFRFFLSVSIIYFLLESFIGFVQTSEKSRSFSLNNDVENGVSMDSLINEQPENFVLNSSTNEVLKGKKLGISQYYSDKTLDSLSFFESYSKRGNIYYSYYLKTKIENPIAALDSLGHINTFKYRWLYSRSVSVYKIIHNTDEFFNYLKAKLPFFLFFFAPIYALFFWLSYSRNKYNFIEHVIFVFHIFSFIFLYLIIFSIPDIIFNSTFFQTLLFAIIGPLYFYFALKKFYGQGKWTTLFKFVFLSIIFSLSFMVAIGFFIAISAALY